jgi:hypothetical protein
MLKTPKKEHVTKEHPSVEQLLSRLQTKISSGERFVLNVQSFHKFASHFTAEPSTSSFQKRALQSLTVNGARFVNHLLRFLSFFSNRYFTVSVS